MQMRTKCFAAVLICLVVANLLGSDELYATTQSSECFASLQQRLIDDGLDAALIREIYSQPGVEFEAKGVALFFVHRESKVNYGQYTDKRLINRARKYMRKYAAELSAAEMKYGVDANVITAIILIESQFGSLLGKRSILNTLSTMAALFDPQVRELLWKEMADNPELTREIFEQKARRRSRWAYPELKAFLEHVTREGHDPVSITGSYAGAMGIAQFMPSNIPVLARDGNGDGRVDLFDHADAIASIAYFLQRHGWRPGIDRQKAEKVIHHYNHSQRYVEAVLKIADILKG